MFLSIVPAVWKSSPLRSKPLDVNWVTPALLPAGVSISAYPCFRDARTRHPRGDRPIRWVQPDRASDHS